MTEKNKKRLAHFLIKIVRLEHILLYCPFGIEPKLHKLYYESRAKSYQRYYDKKYGN